MNYTLKKTFDYKKRNGLKKTVQRMIHKAIGIGQYDDMFNTLFYFLNAYSSPGSLPPATGDLRKLQLCDVEMLRIFDEVCAKEGLEYWIDWGTLLGAVRHGGFIPWDDDVDVSMTRSSYNRALEVLPEALKKYGIDVSEKQKDILIRIGVGYKHYSTGIWIDVFPVESVNNLNGNVTISGVEKKIMKFKKYYLRNKFRISHESMMNKKREMIGCIWDELRTEDKSKKIFFYSPEDVKKIFYYEEDTIFPLKRMKFEGISVNVPNNIHNCLVTQYGENYMMFPKTGLEHHGNETGKISNWAKNSGTDMDVILLELKKVII